MTEKIKQMVNFLKAQDYRKLRTDKETDTKWDMENLQAYAAAFCKLAKNEKPIIFENDSLGFNRYEKIVHTYSWGNITSNYARVITDGLDKTISDINSAISAEGDASKREYGEIMLSMLEAALLIADNYREAAKQKGNQKLYNALSKIPHKGAESLYEAVVFLKFCIFILRLAGVAHITIGRFDQYMYPFYLKSKALGVSDDKLFELVEEFFISINYDTDLYYGMQRGDNGQSMVLGGFDESGNDMFNELSKMCMDASLELSLIDPKINLRVGKNTSMEMYEYATMLTRKGLGFPQYCNDDVVIPGLIKLGYSPKDAYNYTVAACWEYIVPNCSMDIPNLAVMDFPMLVNNVITKKLVECESFEELAECVKNEVSEECNRIIAIKRKHPKDRCCLFLLTDVLPLLRCYGAWR